jgi:hypothetical protein
MRQEASFVPIAYYRPFSLSIPYIPQLFWSLNYQIKWPPLLICKYFSSNFFCGTGTWTQGIHREPLCQPLFVMGFIGIGSRKLFCQGWLPTMILFLSASWVTRIISMSHWCPGLVIILMILFIYLFFYSFNFTYFWNRVLLCSLGWPWIPYHPASSRVLGL